MSVQIREANPEDIDAIFKFIHKLADYERAAHEAVLSKDHLFDSLFGENPQVFCVLSTISDGQGATSEVITGFAIWHLNYSTWLAKHGLYIEDLFVDPGYRGLGHGKALLRYLAKICVDRGYPRLQWWVLDWNKPAIDFYESIGAKAMDEWTVFRVSGDELQKLANT